MEEETPSTPSPKPSVSSKTHHPLLENPKISTTEFPCAYCHRVFRLKSAQKRHTSIVHEKTEKFYCLSCLKDSYCKPHIMVLDKQFSIFGEISLIICQKILIQFKNGLKLGSHNYL